MKSYEAETQAYATFGDKLLQHPDLLLELRRDRRIRPVNVQLAPTEACDSDCPFCSVSGRPQSKRIPFEKIAAGLRTFRDLGAKAIEITGGGNPILYRDGDRTINDIIRLAADDLSLEIGIITNSKRLDRHLDRNLHDRIAWIRVSLIKLDEGKTPEDYDFDGFPEDRLGFSYIFYDGTTATSVEKMARLVELHPGVKFVRTAADCLTEDSLTVKEKWGPALKAIDRHGKFFIKEIGANFHPYLGGCWVGGIRPYWVHDGVYICTSHVLKHRTYHPTWKLCDHDGIAAAWASMNERLGRGESPYPIDIAGECWHCYYANNNRLLDAVTKRLPDSNFV